MHNIIYEYRFEFPSGRSERFHLELNSTTLAPQEPLPAKLPDWTRLDFKRCEGCPLSSLESPYCPLAARLSPVIEHVSDLVSIEEVDVTVILDERVITRSATVQEGLSSLMGIVIATSGCPRTAFFKPMARFHLPFANMEETFYRAASMYMLGQYYRWQANLSADLDMKGLLRYYADVSDVNRGMAARIRSTQREDGAVNAIVLLDMFVKGLPDQVTETLEELKPLFNCYLEEKNIV